MATWAEKTKKKLLESTLPEPKTKMARLRMLLPELLHVKAAGASGIEIMEFLASQGLQFPSRKAFYMAFERAQQAGPLLLASTNVTEKPITKVEETTQEKSLYNQEAASRSQVGPLQKDRDYVVPVIASKSKDVRIDKNPNIDDLV